MCLLSIKAFNSSIASAFFSKDNQQIISLGSGHHPTRIIQTDEKVVKIFDACSGTRTI